MSLCPCCKVLEKNPKCGYCNLCNRKKVAARYRAAHAGKPKGNGWRSIGCKPVIA